MIKPISIKNISIGSGRVKICVPIVGINKEEIRKEIDLIKNSSADLVEWRGDFYEDLFYEKSLKDILTYISEELSGLPIIFTLRTGREGGNVNINEKDYCEILESVIKSKLVDIIDIEMFQGEEIVKSLIYTAHENDQIVIISNHDFNKTPDQEEIISRLRKMQDLGGDLLKIALMPLTKKDVITLMSATEEMVRDYAKKPVIAISMSELGLISRITGEFFGSSISFAGIGKISAPGQIDAEELKDLLTIFHKNYRKNNIFLIGFMGSGKSTVSQQLEKVTGMVEVDIDHMIIKDEGKAISEIFNENGEEYFRNIETQILSNLIKEDNQIISCGGGIVLKEDNLRLMKENGTIVLLTASPENTLKRVKDSNERPILNGNMNIEYIEMLMEKRMDRYIKSADIIIETDNKSISQICYEILVKLENNSKK